jgi:hypothetical protein
MVHVADNEDMFAIALIAVLVVACVLAGVYGVDSRVDERARRVN